MNVSSGVVTVALTFACVITGFATQAVASSTGLFPTPQATGVNPDTPLRISFPTPPTLGTRGKIRVLDAATGAVVDTLDMSLPPGPRNTRTRSPYDRLTYAVTPTAKAISGPQPDGYQRRFIGGRTEASAYHFYPVLIDGNVATVQLHAPLAYGKTYEVRVDAGVFMPAPEVDKWTFTTKTAPPPAGTRRLVVAADGSGDFGSVQAAVDFVPEASAALNPERTTIFIRSGIYEEIVAFRDKANISFIGEDRERTVIRYANNGIFNARPDGGDAGEMLRRFPNRRAVFAATRSHGIHVANLTLLSMGDKPAQAEALLLLGEQAIVSHVNIDGSGDALQATGTLYVGDSRVSGHGDNVLGSGSVFFKDCDMVSTFGPHVWVRNGEGQRGNVFVDCRFRTTGGAETVFARAPTNNGIDYPHAEVVLLNCRVDGVRPEGWGAVGRDIANIRYWEHDTRDLASGAPVDASRRAPHSRQLTMEKDAKTIADYRTPAFVLKGWTPVMAAFFIAPPKAVTSAGATVIEARAAGLPAVRYQWLKNGQPIAGETRERLGIADKDRAARYALVVSNAAGSLTSASIAAE